MGTAIIKRREAKIEGGEKDTNQDPNFVKELLALHDKYMAVVNDQFAGNSLLQKALKEASFVSFLFRVPLKSWQSRTAAQSLGRARTYGILLPWRRKKNTQETSKKNKLGTAGDPKTAFSVPKITRLVHGPPCESFFSEGISCP